MDDTTELAGRFLHNTSRLEELASAVGAERWHAEPASGVESAIRILGRIGAKRRKVLRRLGQDLSLEPWESSFMNGPLDAEDEVPSPAELVLDFAENGRLLAAHVEELTDEDARREWGAPQPDGSTSTVGALAFHAMDESSELGQLEVVGRLLGAASPA